ncbi:MAG: hypothetical protein M0Z65_03020 [Firmicutes bacterium]|uniref:Uncharacterized protein n=1 Tax=Melghirimyces thermohalophilus TaxID=1236220 RepID=A0A1G6R1S1_9BACL|nr:hypothetical protein [Melghirimyces thermohalophilus]MDA8352151.1 hypothetical protein [Bacillota bacterium]SDC97985.1 hypothetical protein SAMN04488112_12519 [Melghirimyces thermohalophilus]
MEKSKGTSWKKRLLTGAGIGWIMGWIFGLNAVPPRVSLEGTGGDTGVIFLPPFLYWGEVFGFAVWFAVLGSMISGGLTLLRRLRGHKRSEES